MMEGRAAYAINMILLSIKEQLVRGSFHILTDGKNKLKGAKLDKAIQEKMDQYFWDADNAVSCYYEFEILKKGKSLKFTRMAPYVISFFENTTNFYTNFRNSVIAQVSESIKKEGKLKDKDNIQGMLAITIFRKPQG